MGRIILSWLSLLAAAGLGALTLVGLLAPLVPALDIINHFRPFWLVAAILVVVAAWIARSRKARWSAGIVLAINAALAAWPLAYAAGTAERATLRVAAFNIWTDNRALESTAAFLLGTEADVILLEEIDARLAADLLPRLTAAYPYVVSCVERGCHLMLLSRTEPAETGMAVRTVDAPPRVWATFINAETGRPYTVTGTHVEDPFRTDQQARNIRALGDLFAAAEGTQIIAGDFNLTPFSWKLTWFAAVTGLRRHATFGFSWPAFRYAPVVLIDNLFATPDVRSAGVTIGPSGYGSDHLPVVFDLALE